MDNKFRLGTHIKKHFEYKCNKWKDLNCSAKLKSHLLRCLDKWKSLFDKVFLNDHRFVNIAEPVTKDTVFEPCNYYMRTDGSIVFIEVTLVDEKGELIAAHPLRFPFEPGVRARYLSNNIEPDIFGTKMKCTTRVFWNRRKDYVKQTEECWRIINNQRNTRYPILPLYFHNQNVYGENLRIIQTPVFRRENFVVGFPARKALDYMYNVLRFEPIVKGTDWLINKAHTYPFSNFKQIQFKNLGVTGSSSFGDTHDKEDFDVIFFNNFKNLKNYRDFLAEGIKHGIFNPVSHNRSLRVYQKEIRIKCNHNKPLLLCTFMNLDNARQDFLFRSRFNILGKIDYMEMTVTDDSENMITLPRVRVANFNKIYCKKRLDLNDNMLLIQMMSTSRGAYLKGTRLGIRNVLLVEFKPEKGKKFNALVTTGWYDAKEL